MKVTDVIPAVAPQRRRRAGERGSPGEASKNCARLSVFALYIHRAPDAIAIVSRAPALTLL